MTRRKSKFHDDSVTPAERLRVGIRKVSKGAALNASAQNSSSLAQQRIERRQHGRRLLHSPVRIVYNSSEAPSAQIGQGLDISAGGLSFETDSDLDFYHAIRLEYTDDDRENFNRTARLLYRMNRRYGAYFVDADQA
jgi:hypothetical protein